MHESDIPAAVTLARSHHEAGRLAQAELIYRQILELAPQHADALHLLGAALHQSGQNEPAVEYFSRAIALHPDRAIYYNSLGSAYCALQQYTDAINSYQHSLALKGDYAEAQFNLGVVYSDLDNIDMALQCYRNAIALKPGFAAAYYNCGIVLKKHRRFDEALEYFREVVRHQPHNETALHFIAALSSTASERAPAQYIAGIFDGSAETFEQHLVQALGYDTPQRLVELIGRCAGPPAANWNVLDLGCGTGLVGAAIAPYASSLVGVDLSGRMLDQARTRRLYQRLEQQELLQQMQQEESASYDLIIAADVLIYFGRLDAVFREARRLLKMGGLFACSVEALDSEAQEEGPAYRLDHTGRYAHSSVYLKKLAAEYGFLSGQMVYVRTRLEAGEPVQAWLALWQC
ncbi:MAG: tetratricopeptide repeat protein [Pseudomonadota bacterium]